MFFLFGGGEGDDGIRARYDRLLEQGEYEQFRAKFYDMIEKNENGIRDKINKKINDLIDNRRWWKPDGDCSIDIDMKFLYYPSDIGETPYNVVLQNKSDFDIIIDMFRLNHRLQPKTYKFTVKYHIDNGILIESVYYHPEILRRYPPAPIGREHLTRVEYWGGYKLPDEITLSDLKNTWLQIHKT